MGIFRKLKRGIKSSFRKIKNIRRSNSFLDGILSNYRKSYKPKLINVKTSEDAIKTISLMKRELYKSLLDELMIELENDSIFDNNSLKDSNYKTVLHNEIGNIENLKIEDVIKLMTFITDAPNNGEGENQKI
jgi:hypothetical protein